MHRSPSCMEAMSSQRRLALSCEVESEKNHFQERKIDCAACRVITGCVIEGSIVFYLKRPILKYLLSLCIPGFKPLPILYMLLYYYTVPSACTVPCRPDSYFRFQATLCCALDCTQDPLQQTDAHFPRTAVIGPLVFASWTIIISCSSQIKEKLTEKFKKYECDSLPNTAEKMQDILPVASLLLQPVDFPQD